MQAAASTRPRRAPYFTLAAVLVVLLVLLNLRSQSNFFDSAVFNGNFRTFIPAMLAAAAQTVVILGGGVDLSIGGMVCLIDVVMVRLLPSDASTGDVLLVCLAMLGLGMTCGAFNGFVVAYLRLQPIVTTFATSFVFAGLALIVLPTPGGQIPASVVNVYYRDPLGISLAFWIGLVILLLWKMLTATRFRSYLYGVGGDAKCAYESGVPVARVWASSYIVSGFLTAGAAIATVLSTGSGDPNIGTPYTLPSIVAVVIGGTLLRGGRGGIAGSLLGALVLGLLSLLVSVAIASTYWQPFINGIAIVVALALPGLISRLRSMAGRFRAQGQFRMIEREEIG